MRRYQRFAGIMISAVMLSTMAASAQDTYAEKLGFPKGSKVLILHVDDAGMSWDSNEGAKRALKEGVATSVSVMMPCPWVPGFVRFLKEEKNVDAGLHLTLTSEWRDYRWAPLSGKPAVPGLVDTEGAMWRSVEETTSNATADEVEREMRAQLERARSMGFTPTHLDSHMGTVFAKPEYLERYIRLGVAEKIPVMFPGGHNTMIIGQRKDLAAMADLFRKTGQQIWDAGLPVLDDLHNVSYDWDYPAGITDEKELRQFATRKYMESIRILKPGLTMVIMHCTHPTEVFQHISDSGRIRKGDLMAMTDPAFRKFLKDEGIILTTWREIMQRRQNIR